METVGDLSSVCQTPGGIVLQIGYTLYDVPMPLEWQFLEHVDVVADERLAVEHDGEEVDW